MPEPDGPVLVTGAAGFIGSHVCGALIGRGRRVVGVDNFDPFYDEGWKRANLREVGPGLELIEADIRDAGAMQRLMLERRPATVIHLAAKAGVRPSIAAPGEYARTNVEGTSNVLEAAGRAGCGRVLLASSSSVYGNSSRPPFREDDPALEPISPYAATKRGAELVARAFHALTAVPVACLRFFTVYGPRQRPDLAIMSFMLRLSRGEPLPVFGDGSMARDFTFIDDIVAGVLAAEAAIDAHGYRVWNLGGNRPVSVREMVEAIARATGIEARIERLPEQPGDVRLTCADVTRARDELGLEARTPFDEGLARQWAWVRSRGLR